MLWHNIFHDFFVQAIEGEGFRRVSLGRMFFTCFEEVGDQICDQSLRRQCPRLPHL